MRESVNPSYPVNPLDNLKRNIFQLGMLRLEKYFCHSGGFFFFWFLSFSRTWYFMKLYTERSFSMGSRHTMKETYLWSGSASDFIAPNFSPAANFCLSNCLDMLWLPPFWLKMKFSRQIKNNPFILLSGQNLHKYIGPGSWPVLGCPAHQHVMFWSDAPYYVLDPRRFSKVSSILITNIPENESPS